MGRLPSTTPRTSARSAQPELRGERVVRRRNLVIGIGYALQRLHDGSRPPSAIRRCGSSTSTSADFEAAKNAACASLPTRESRSTSGRTRSVNGGRRRTRVVSAAQQGVGRESSGAVHARSWAATAQSEVSARSKQRGGRRGNRRMRRRREGTANLPQAWRARGPEGLPASSTATVHGYPRSRGGHLGVKWRARGDALRLVATVLH